MGIYYCYLWERIYLWNIHGIHTTFRFYHDSQNSVKDEGILYCSKSLSFLNFIVSPCLTCRESMDENIMLIYLEKR